MVQKEKHFLDVQKLGMTFNGAEGSLEVLRDISFSLGRQEFLCVLGPSGSGKSTLLRLIAGLIKPTRGRFDFGETNITPRISLVFQQANLMPWRNVLQNILLPLELQGVSRDAALSRVNEMIHLVGLEGFSQAWPSELSGGMAQRVAIARAFIAEPDLLLLDEPFGSLDALIRERMGTELLNIWQSQRKAVIMVTHSISEALLLSDRVIVFSPRPGKVIMDLTVTLPRPRQEELRYTPEFQLLEKELRKAIR
ncbi:MAG: NitT/TauT family transport system ATP-binding protein [Chloroflexi bacterium]|nr:MAG: NitT/TauT family transport system ATP-binding protein [Chloroflexota bacterium]MBA4375453.1 ABC transporter [Anaerolinea sp.]